MSKPVKNLITRQYGELFGDANGAVLIDIRGVDSNTTNDLRTKLKDKHIRVTVVQNALARRAIAGQPLEPLGQWMEGSNTVAYPMTEDTSVVSIARELLDWAKKIEKLQFKGAVMDGIVFGPAEIKKLSEYPTREEAQAKVVQLLLSPAQKLVGAIKSPASNLAGLLKTIQEKLEKGETIAKAS